MVSEAIGSYFIEAKSTQQKIFGNITSEVSQSVQTPLQQISRDGRNKVPTST